ncbi:MAG TPA: UvrD-helicase domain-containing protein [Bacteroidales bacterium]|nr:UvrD-helicase domain-containing protein [Bacteroidales bacterium]
MIDPLLFTISNATGRGSFRKTNNYLLDKNHSLQNMVIHGLAGTGKSSYIVAMIRKLIESHAIKPKELLVLSFDRHTKEKYITSSPYLDTNNVLTIHSFCYRELKRMDRLPKQFTNQHPDQSVTDSLNEKDYDSLISEFLKISINTNSRGKRAPGAFKGTIRLIFCDEVQDFREDYIEVVKRLKAINPIIRIVIAGDRHQRIYSFQDRKGKKPLTDVLIRPEHLFEKEEYNTVLLTENHRTRNQSIIRFNNGFLSNEFYAKTDTLYTVKSHDARWKRKPLITYFTTQEEEYAYVERELSKIDTKRHSVAILGRSKVDIELYLKFDRENVSVSTIHKLKGDSRDCIFYVGFSYDKELDPEITTLVYTAISRPVKMLCITSAFPRAKLDKIFGEGTYKLVNLQKKIVKLYTIRKHIKGNKNATWFKLKDNHLDSIVLKVSKDSCPFTPYVKKDGTSQVNYFSCRRIHLPNGVEYSIEKQHRWGTYFFKFEDLGLLMSSPAHSNQLTGGNPATEL